MPISAEISAGDFSRITSISRSLSASMRGWVALRVGSGDS